MAIHVFFDNSNILGGAQSERRVREPLVPWFAFRVYYRNLFDLIENGREVRTAILAGSVPPPSEAIWQYARDKGYGTDLLRRVENDEGNKVEQGVDEILHLKIANTLLDYPNTDILVVATGDGSTSAFNTGFPGQITRALKLGWTVEVWSWTSTLNRCYRQMEGDAGGLLQVKNLDPFYPYVTFVKGGEYYKFDPDSGRAYYTIPDRIVRPLSEIPS